MDSLAVRSVPLSPRALQRRVDLGAVSTSVLAGALVLYVGLQGGGYDTVVRGQVGTVVWWAVLVGAAWGILPAGRLSRAAWWALALFGGFVAWNALAMSWSLSSDRSLEELSRVAMYLGVLLLGVAIHTDRERALRHTVNAVGAAIAIIAALALISRVLPDAFPASHTTGTFLSGAQSRLNWPLNYWNGLAELVALGLPLLLAIATSARRLLTQAAAAAALPVLVLCEYLTFSRAGAIAAGVAVVAFVALAPNRLPKLGTIIAAAAGSAALIAGAVHRGGIENGLTTHAATVQGHQLLIAIVLVCAGVALAQLGIGLATRHGTPLRWLQITPRQARLALAGGIVLALVVAVAAGAPSRISHAWDQFKNPTASPSATGAFGRFGSAAGEGRYQWWKVAVHTTSSSGHLADGSGPGSFQLLWLPHATVSGYVINAHSLYVETLSDVGIVGLALLAAFLALALGAAVRAVVRSRYGARTRAAAVVGAMLAFLVAASVDWTWQLPVLPAAFLLLAAAVLAPAPREVSIRLRSRDQAPGEPEPTDRGRRVVPRVAFVVAALACLVVIAIPLGTTSAVRQSQAAAAVGNAPLAVKDARSAVRLEPGAASAQLQLALALELQRDFPGALAAATHATRDEPQNWSDWLVVSRLQAESGHPSAAIAAYRHARSLNPRSPLFQR
jgi:hypothetical protein